VFDVVGGGYFEVILYDFFGVGSICEVDCVDVVDVCDLYDLFGVVWCECCFVYLVFVELELFDFLECL